jgi:two-component system cell cycle response regulator DivK
MAGELILIVEDNEKNLKLVRDILQFKGYRTLEAGTAGEAISLAGQHQPDLILMDIQLPDMDGEAALGRLRAEPSTLAIPVIALTAQAMAGDRERLLGAGFAGYLAKPISIREFPEQIRQFCEQARPADEAAAP